MGLARTVTLDWRSFMRGEIVEKERSAAPRLPLITGAAGYVTLAPQIVFAATAASKDATWANLFATALGIADWLCLGVIIFAGLIWMFGNRTKALELLIGVASGYLVVRHAVDIRDWLKTI